LVISASRRTDIPAYYSDWFINRLKEKFVYVKNPMNVKQVAKIPLTNDLVDCIVFWTKDARPLMKKLFDINDMGFEHYYFQYTVTPYDNSVEKNVKNKDDIISSVAALSEIIGKERIVWRYDPIIINDNFDTSFHIKMFENYCSRLHNHCNYVMVSFVDVYRHIKKFYNRPDESEIPILSKAIKEICKSYNLQITSCCESGFAENGILQGSCIDKNLIEQICGESLKIKRDNNQRESCLCCESLDIGAYNTCLHGCTYCYANKGKLVADNYNAESPLLCGSLRAEDKLYDRKVQGYKKRIERL